MFKGQIQDLGYGVHMAPQLTWICCLGFINLLCIWEMRMGGEFLKVRLILCDSVSNQKVLFVKYRILSSF